MKWLKKSESPPKDGQDIVILSRDGEYIAGEYEAGSLDETSILWVSDGDGSTFVFYDDFLFWFPLLKRPEINGNEYL